MKNIFLLSIAAIFCASCTSSSTTEERVSNPVQNKILMLKVDYTTNVFEGGKELIVEPYSSSFETNNDYKSPSDFGYIKVFYTPTNTKIFDGTIHWAGEGAMSYPTNFAPANSFVVLNTFAAIPMPVIENILGTTNPPNINYDSVVNQLLYLEKVNDYRASNPTAKVKIFLYTPGVGVGNPATWKWIVMFKN
jgi:hypothetical protein